MTGRDHYEVLGIGRGAGAREIQRAYRALALRYHPDVYSGPDAEWRFREILDAYDVLQDPARRARYDARSRPARELDDSAATSGIRCRPRDVPHFCDEEAELSPLVAMLRHVFAAAPARERSGGWWPQTPPWTTEVWTWR
jgi:DnaJ-class molecular chaperone